MVFYELLCTLLSVRKVKFILKLMVGSKLRGYKMWIMCNNQGTFNSDELINIACLG